MSDSRSQLRDLLKGRNSGEVFLTTIYKFTEGIELLTERNNVICISDEAHRSQVNLGRKLMSRRRTLSDTKMKKGLICLGGAPGAFGAGDLGGCPRIVVVAGGSSAVDHSIPGQYPGPFQRISVAKN